MPTTVTAQLAVIALAGIVMVGGGIVMRMRQDDEGGHIPARLRRPLPERGPGGTLSHADRRRDGTSVGPTLVSWIAAIPLHSFLLGILIGAAIIGALYLCNRVLNLLARWITMALFRARRRPHPAR